MTRSITIGFKQNHSRPHRSISLYAGQKLLEHPLLDITVDNKLRWDSAIGHVYRTVSKRAFFLCVAIDTRELFFDALIKPHID